MKRWPAQFKVVCFVFTQKLWFTFGGKVSQSNSTCWSESQGPGVSLCKPLRIGVRNQPGQWNCGLRMEEAQSTHSVCKWITVIYCCYRNLCGLCMSVAMLTRDSYAQSCNEIPYLATKIMYKTTAVLQCSHEYVLHVLAYIELTVLMRAYSVNVNLPC